MCVGPHVKYSLFLSDFNETCIFSADFGKMLKYQIYIKSVQREPSCFMRTDRHDEENNRFSQFCERAYLLSIFHASTQFKARSANTRVVKRTELYRGSKVINVKKHCNVQEKQQIKPRAAEAETVKKE